MRTRGVPWFFVPARRGPAQRQSRTTSSAMRPSGSVRSTPPMRMASLGMPKTTQRRFVLRDRGGAGLLHLQHAARAVVAHAGHDDADRVAARVARGRAEQHVHRGPVAADQRPVAHLDVVARAAALQQHVAVARARSAPGRASPCRCPRLPSTLIAAELVRGARRSWR